MESICDEAGRDEEKNRRSMRSYDADAVILSEINRSTSDPSSPTTTLNVDDKCRSWMNSGLERRNEVRSAATAEWNQPQDASKNLPPAATVRIMIR